MKSSINKSVVALAGVFTCSVFLLAWIFYWSFPNLDEADWAKVRLPWTIEDAKSLGQLLSQIKETNFLAVVFIITATYVFLQTFSIPGSASLSILAGYLFPFPLALLLVCVWSATGATCCYLLSSLVGQPLLNKYCPQRLDSLRALVAHHSDDMLWYIIFLRITPFLPNWFINLAAPVVGVKLSVFYWGTFFGVAPPSVLFIQAGTALYELTTTTGHISWNSLVVLGLLALLSLLPVLARKYLRRKLE